MTRTRFRTQDPQLLGATVPSSVARATWHAAFVPLVSDGQVCDVIPPSHIATSWTPSRYVIGLLFVTDRQPRQPTGPSGCSFLPPFRNYTSQQLAVHLRQIFLHGPLLYCSVFRLHVLCATVRNLMAEMCFCCGSTEDGRDWRQ